MAHSNSTHGVDRIACYKIKVLLEAEADPDAVSDHGETALLVCLTGEDPINHQIVELLLISGAKTHYPATAITPLFGAVSKGDGGAIKILERYGFDDVHCLLVILFLLRPLIINHRKQPIEAKRISC